MGEKRDGRYRGEGGKGVKIETEGRRNKGKEGNIREKREKKRKRGREREGRNRGERGGG